MTEQSANTQDSARYGWQSPPHAANAVSVGTVDIRINNKVCPECGAHVASRAESCSDCGENLVHAPKQIRCMHCQTTASSELTVCPGCGRELREAPPKLMTVGAPALLAVLLVALLVTQWSRISPLAWARTNLVRGVVLVEDIGARIEPEMVIVMTPIVPETTMSVVGDASPSVGVDTAVVTLVPAEDGVSDAQAVAIAPATNVEPPNGEPEEVLAASVVQELPFGVGGPAPDEQVQRSEGAPETLPPANEPDDPPAPTATSLPPTSTPTATPESAAALPTPTDAPTEAPAVMSAGLAASLATDEPSATSTIEVDAEIVDGDAERSSVEVAALAARETTSSTPTVTPTGTPTQATTPMPTPTATPIVYQVRAGDTLVSIASAYGVDVEALMAANEMVEQDVYVLQQGQMLFVPLPEPEPVAAAANAVANARVEAPQLLVPTSDARVGCATGGTLIWQRVQFVKDSDKYVLHLGFVSGRKDNGQESVTWVLAQSSPVTVTEWQLDTGLCELASDEYDHQWRWWVEVAETVDGDTVSVSQPSEIRGFTWE